MGKYLFTQRQMLTEPECICKVAAAHSWWWWGSGTGIRKAKLFRHLRLCRAVGRGGVVETTITRRNPLQATSLGAGTRTILAMSTNPSSAIANGGAAAASHQRDGVPV